MIETENGRPGSIASPEDKPRSSPAEPDEAHITRVVEEYRAVLQAGQKPDRQAFLARCPEIADALTECFDALEFIENAAPQLHEAAVEHRNDPFAAVPVQPEGPLGDFRIVREIGRGGMGVVYEAMQISLGRRVALKVLPFAAAIDPRQLQRFKNEAQAAAQLHHTNIVPVYGVGCERGVHFYAMQYIEGQTLAKLIADLRWQIADMQKRANSHDDQPAQPATQNYEPARSLAQSAIGNRQSAVPLTTTPPVAVLSTERSIKSAAYFRSVVSLGVQAAEALEQAHQLGVIHRDIKPANLLVDAGGRLWVTDFGLAHCQSQPGLTMTGDLVGTLRYMSPEQALARRVTVDARTDIYSLGVTLYELLTLQPAYDGRDREEVLRQLAFEEPRSPSRWNKAVPVELETIVLKAMAKNPEDRYATAEELADDLGRFLEDKPIKAKRPTLRQRAAKWARRHKTVVRAAAVVLVLAIVASAVSTALIWQAKNDVERANAGLSDSLNRERQNSYYQRIALAEREWSANNLGRVQQLLEECPTDLRSWEWHYLKRLRLDSIPPLAHAAVLFSAALSPDGRWIAAGGLGGSVSVWDVTTGQERFRLEAHKDHVHCVAFCPDGRRLATASWDGTAKVWDFERLPVAGVLPMIHTLPHQGPVNHLSFSPDGRWLATASDDGTVKVWNTASGQDLGTLKGHSGAVSCVAFSPDGQDLASASDNSTVRVWDAQTGRVRLTFSGHVRPVRCVAFSPDGRWLASASSDFNTRVDGEVKLWDAQTGREVFTLGGHVAWIFDVAFSPDGQRLASAGMDGNVKLWDLRTGKEALTLRGHRGAVRSVAFSRDGNRLVSSSHDHSVRVWDATPLRADVRQEVLSLRGHDAGVRSVAFSSDGSHLASVGDDAIVRIWDLKLGEGSLAAFPIQALDAVTGMCANVVFSRDGRRLAAGGGGGGVAGPLKVWDALTWKELHPELKGGCPVAFSPDGRYLAAVGPDLTIVIFDPTTGREIRRSRRGHNWAVTALVFHPVPHTARLASASGDGAVHIWDLATSKEIEVLTHTLPLSLAFDPDGRLLASGGWGDGSLLASGGWGDGSVKVWDTQTWEVLHELPDSTSRVNCVAFHPKDSRLLAWGGSDATVKIWDRTTKKTRTLRGHTSWVESIAFSPDGKWLASASLDGTIKLWPVPFVPEARGPAAGAPGLTPEKRQ